MMESMLWLLLGLDQGAFDERPNGRVGRESLLATGPGADAETIPPMSKGGSTIAEAHGKAARAWKGAMVGAAPANGAARG